MENPVVTEHDVHHAFLEKRPDPAPFNPCDCNPWSLFPIVETVKNYETNNLFDDILAGLSEAILAVPQGMSYALLAGLDPIYGLYCCMVYPFIYLFFGTSHHASLGVSAIEAVLLGETLDALIGDDAPMSFRMEIATMISLQLGVIYILMRIAQLGMLADFLADPVLQGFSSASAFVIASSQLPSFFGNDLIASNWVPVVYYQSIRHITESNWAALIMGASCIVFLLLVRYTNRNIPILQRFGIPGQLLLIIGTTALTAIFNWDTVHDLPIVGSIPSGFPALSVPFLWGVPDGEITEEGIYSYDGGRLPIQVIMATIPISFMYFVIHVCITKSFAAKHDYRIRANQELLSLGLANIVGSFISCFPNATSMSRTSINSSIGGKTILHNIVYSAFILLTLLVITPLLTSLPMTCLAAIVIVGVLAVVSIDVPMRLYRIGGVDFWLWVSSFTVTLIFGIFLGVLVSVCISIVWLLQKSARPHIATLGKLPNTNVYRDINRFPDAELYEGLVIIRMDASLNFANSDFLENYMTEVSNQDDIRVVIMDASSINGVDVTAVAALDRILRCLRTKGKHLLFANWRGPMRDFLIRCGFYEIIGPQQCYLCLDDAVVGARRMIDDGTCWTLPEPPQEIPHLPYTNVYVNDPHIPSRMTLRTSVA